MELPLKSIDYLIPRQGRAWPSTRPKKATQLDEQNHSSESKLMACLRYKDRESRIPCSTQDGCKMVVGELRWPGEDGDTDQSQQD